MSETQLELASGPAVEQSDVQWLETTLKNNTAWLSADELLLTINKSGETNKRWLRALAAESEWIISGNKGYRHLENATPDEVAHAVNRLSSQAEKMKSRAAALENNAAKTKS